MAATAYLTKPEMAESGGSANPASVYCADLGGVEMGGQLAPDGGWINGADASDVVQMCVFPDLSIIDSWGLAYHTMGTIRGRGPGAALPLETGEHQLSVAEANRARTAGSPTVNNAPTRCPL